jgi:hypothetical protein
MPVYLLPLEQAFCQEKKIDSGKRQILLAFRQGFLTLRAKVFKIGVALRKHITLDNLSIPQAGRFSASRAIDVCFCDGGSSGPQNIFLHSRHLPFFFLH